MDIRALSSDAVLWTLFLDAVSEIEQEKRAALLAALEQTGVERQRNSYGLATFVPGKPAAVVNERILLEWVREHRPDMLIQRVNPAYMAALKKEAEQYGCASDPSTGEVIPGVTVAQSGPGLRIVKNPEARSNARETIRRLVTQGLRELEGDHEGMDREPGRLDS